MNIECETMPTRSVQAVCAKWALACAQAHMSSSYPSMASIIRQCEGLDPVLSRGRGTGAHELRLCAIAGVDTPEACP